MAVLDVRLYYGQAFGLTELVNRVPACAFARTVAWAATPTCR
ncbi:MAG: hypothetical protein WKG07_03785 [Hymenobacter sp.]